MVICIGPEFPLLHDPFIDPCVSHVRYCRGSPVSTGQRASETIFPAVFAYICWISNNMVDSGVQKACLSRD